jgi:hypothetical protein
MSLKATDAKTEADEWTIEMESKKFGPHVTVTRGGYITLEIGGASPVGVQSWEFCDDPPTREQALAIGEATAAWLAALPRANTARATASSAPDGFEVLAGERNLHCEENRAHGEIIGSMMQCQECMLIMCPACALNHYTSDHPHDPPKPRDQQR